VFYDFISQVNLLDFVWEVDEEESLRSLQFEKWNLDKTLYKIKAKNDIFKKYDY
jgi:hypothetical protein